MNTIVLAGGCFWGVEEYFARKKGIVATKVGYANCKVDNPTYEQVCSHATGCTEAVQIEWDESTISLDTILDSFLSIIDPTTKNRQGPDIGNQYRSGMYYQDEEQRIAMQQAWDRCQARYDRPLATEVLPLENFWQAEEYHQRYLKKNPGGYCHIRLDDHVAD